METTLLKSLVWLVIWSNSPIEPEVQQESWGVLSTQELERRAGIYCVSSSFILGPTRSKFNPCKYTQLPPSCVFAWSRGRWVRLTRGQYHLCLRCLCHICPLHLSQLESAWPAVAVQSVGQLLLGFKARLIGLIRHFCKSVRMPYLVILGGFFIFLFCVMEMLYALWKHTGFD